ncbi:MAG TPA: carbon-nitrogen hydrolase family protein [Acidimicrobiales bacterium]
MREPLDLAVAQPLCSPGDLQANVAAHASMVRDTAAHLIAFPELSLTGYQLDIEAVRVDDARFAPLVDACAEVGSIALVGAPVLVKDQRFIATLAVSEFGATVAHRKTFLGGDEPRHFAAGPPAAAALSVDGWHVGLGICKDTSTPRHVDDVVGLGVDLYVAALVHHPDELGEQDDRAARILARGRVPVAFASAAGRAGADYPETAGHSSIWAADGTVLARAGDAPGAIARTTLQP